jgi:hypothetical protein
MSGADLGYSYAQTRLQSRYGTRPTEADWRQAEATQDLDGLLQLLRVGALARWTARLGAQPGVHQIERGLRGEWLAATDEVAGWQPPAGAAVSGWMRWLPYLPALQKLARGGRVPPWMRADPVLGPIVAREPRERREALEHTPLAPLAQGFAASPDVAAAWQAHWRTLWPANASTRVVLEHVLLELNQYRARLEEAPDSANSLALAATLRQRLERCFRRHPLSPAAAVTYLRLLLLDVERLRGLLSIRALRARAVAPP